MTDKLQAFFEQYYPGVEYTPIVAATPAALRAALGGTLEPPEPPGPPGPPEPQPARQLVSLHIQESAGPWLEFITLVQPTVVKLVFGMERAEQIKQVSPGTKVVYRPWVAHQGEFWEAEPHKGAHAFLATFKDSLLRCAAWIDYVETLNELIATDDIPGIQRTVAFDIAFCEALAEIGYPARPIILTAGVGNPQHGDQTRLLIPAARAAVEAGGALGYHAYWGARPGYCTMPTAWQHYAGRALESWDPVFREAGLYPDYIFGECGAIYEESGVGMPSAGAGWKYKATLAGDWQAYLAQILDFRRRLNEWNATHGGRCLGATLFTVGGGDEWKYFELSGQLAALAEAVK